MSGDKRKPTKTVGIIGGMGPLATIDLMRRVVLNTPASDDGDHIRMLVDNNPRVPSRINALIEGTGVSPAPCLIDMARSLESSGADFLAMPCNTAHHYHPDIAAAVSIPVMSIVEEALEHVVAQLGDEPSIGMLASSALQKIDLYEHPAEQRGVRLHYPATTDQHKVMQLINAIKAGQHSAAQIAQLEPILKTLQSAGADCALLACTEFSAVSSQIASPLPVLDASEILARAIVKAAMGS